MKMSMKHIGAGLAVVVLCSLLVPGDSHPDPAGQICPEDCAKCRAMEEARRVERARGQEGEAG